MDFDCVVIGAGVVGLAVGRALAQAGFETLIAERADNIGTETSSRNSEVIHAGIYYPQGSLKARACRVGRDLMYEFCQSHHVEHKKCGKLIVAVDTSELTKLEAIKQKAQANGVLDLTWLSAEEVGELEPEIASVGALWSPSTGIIDSHGYMLALLGEFEASGGVLAFETPLTSARKVSGGLELSFGGQEPTQITTKWLINAAGLSAQDVAGAIIEFPKDKIPKRYMARGNYFNLAGKQIFSRLIYPAPVQGGLGVHVTLDISGQVRFGPDVEWLDDDVIDYRVDAARADAFYAAIRRYWPALADEALVPAYSGIRPKISPRGGADADFRIDCPQTHGNAGIIHMFGIESPGLTASLALANEVTSIVRSQN